MNIRKHRSIKTICYLFLFSILVITVPTSLMADGEKKRDKDEKKDKKHKKDKKDDEKNRSITITNLGTMQATPLAAERDINLSGRAMIVRHPNGTTTAYTQVLGLAAMTPYGAHVHNLSCDLGGGGHYKNDLSVSGAVQDNEIWVSFTTDNSGTGLGQGSGNFLARPEAQSIVIHDTDGGRLACADLPRNYKGATVHQGQMTHFDNGDVFGTAQLSRANGSTFATLQVAELAADTAYPAHVHNLPCTVDSGGSHYKIDPQEATTIVTNEAWLTVITDNRGNGSSTNLMPSHLARPEAQSVVIHSDTGRLGCANLSAVEPGRVKTQGAPITTAAGLEKGHNLSGKASMTRQDDGRTKVKVEVAGLSANTTYPSHVHNLPCKLGGGSHYKINPSIMETLKSNEIWPKISTNKMGMGEGKATVSHIARPEAQSIVIHDPIDGARLGCFNLD